MYKASSLLDIDILNDDDDSGVVCLLLMIGEENEEGFDEEGGKGAAADDEAELGRDKLIWASVFVTSGGVSITDDIIDVSIITSAAANDDDDDDDTIGASTTKPIGAGSTIACVINFPLSPIKFTS